MKPSQLYLAILFAFIMPAAYAASSTTYSRLTSRDGLVSNSVNCILEDAEGFIWFGTNNGLCRYNGYTFDRFTSDYRTPDRLSSNTIRLFLQDNTGKIWLSNLKCIDRFDPQTGLVEKNILPELK